MGTKVLEAARGDLDTAISALFHAEERLGAARMAVSREMRTARQAAGLTLAQVAARARVSISYVSDMERGRRDPSVQVCEALLALLDLRLASSE